MLTHIVKPGDTLWAIARRYGIKSWQQLYHDPANAAFRAKRPNPNLIYPGDKINIPTAPPKLAGGKEHTKPGKLPPELARFQEQLRQEIAKDKAANWDEFVKAMVALTKWTKLTTFIAGRAGQARQIALLYAFVRSIGLPPSEVTEVLKTVFSERSRWVNGMSYLAKDPEMADKIFKAITEPDGRMTIVFKRLNFAGDVARVLGFVINLVANWQRGDFMTAWADIYKTAMSRAIPWAGFLDGVEGVITAFWPGAKDSTKWKYLRALDLIGLGANAVDALGVALQTIFQDGPNPMNWDAARIKRLEDRMRASPAKVFVEMGDQLADAIDEFESLTPAQFDEFLRLTNPVNWLKEALAKNFPKK